MKPQSLKPSYAAPSSWWQHVPIAHWLVATLQPETVVELGTHYGVSFFAFCEAAERLSPKTFVFAVDTWRGDDQAGMYSEEVFNRVNSHQQLFHKHQSRLLRSTFDEAAEHFGKSTIDLLHIDGLHTYEAVSHDLDNWIPKLKPGSTILFHDTNVREGEFGVWLLWKELQDRSDMQCIEVRNGHGLGIATLGTTAPAWHQDFVTIAPDLINQGILLDEIAQLKSECSWGESDFRPYQIQRNESKELLIKTQSELFQTQSQLSHLQSQLALTQSELSLTQSELSLTQSELSLAQSQLSLTKSELSQTQALLRQSENKIRELFSSSSWKLASPLRHLKSLISGGR
jgi:hypothetical protein